MASVQGKASTVSASLLAAAEQDAGEYVFHLEDGPVAIHSAELAERASRGARRLITLGVEPGDAVGVLGPNSPEWLVAAYSIWLAGAAVVPVQIPMRVRDPDAFAAQVRGLVKAGNCRRVLADPRLLSLLPETVAASWEEAGEESTEEPPEPESQSTAVIQFTSGSTAAPKGAIVTHAAMIAQLDALFQHYWEGRAYDQTTVSWVPFFHDLGLVASVALPPYVHSKVELLPTELFARDPAEWLRLIERTRALGTLGPSSAFGSAIRAADRTGERIDLSSLIVAYFAAEGVDPQVVQRMAEIGTEKLGLRPDALGSTYGLAEAVLTVSTTPVGRGMRVDRVSLEELVQGGVANAAGTGPSRTLVSCGTPLFDVWIADPEGEILDERHVGEIRVGGPSLCSGYVGTGADSPISDGWLRTGDLGYLADGDLYVTGRIKDMVIAQGRNYYPEDFEWAAARVDGVRPGRCVAFSRPGVEEVVVMVEPSGDVNPEELSRAVRRGIQNAVGMVPAEVLVVPRDTVEKTTSGKLRRAAMRDDDTGTVVAGGK